MVSWVMNILWADKAMPQIWTIEQDLGVEGVSTPRGPVLSSRSYVLMAGFVCQLGLATTYPGG